MIIDFSQLLTNPNSEKSWQYLFLLSIMTDHTPNCNDWQKALGVDIKNPPITLDVKITVNGVEMPFDHWMKRLEERHYENVKREAKKLIDEKLDVVQDKLYKLGLELDEVISQTCEAQNG